MSNQDLESLALYIPKDRRQAMMDGAMMNGEIVGTALFADITRFTPLSEALAGSLGPQRGAEELTIQLNRFYDALIDQQLASELGMDALSIRRAIGDKWAIAISLNNMGNIALDQGDVDCFST